MSGKLFARLAVAVTAIILFGGTGYLGYRFIQDVSRSAAKIESNVPAERSVTVDNTALTAQPDSGFSGSLSQLQPAQEGISSGQDVLVKAGDFGYRYGVPQVRLALQNQGGFTVGGVFVRLSLFLDDNQTAVGEPVVMQANLATPLAAGQTAQTDLNVSDEAWRSTAVSHAKSRRVVAQIVGVNDLDNGGVDYPQTTAGVLLRQVANDWSKPFNPDEAVGVILHETASQVSEGSPNIQVIAEQPPMRAQEIQAAPRVQSDSIDEFLEKPLPTGEPRILSVEIEEYKNGELIQADKSAEKE